ncbi:haloacid dehalogenase [Dothidotthia symphoricarpi CBS 119687]|uniref:Haloacid dehalogenase n=1 Tax=Dothidotthia symphoricarpi CBS 119687 TaxID=1392245 RepID=A0A6A6AUA6_9PLEO|nr:haloacid dehalogenase [Dothidotthia symphoricarpi CBS 119687]KAF2134545.1 haloacid dehalogenase [Dothidotthia symphoricarpi CBS 119687]
MALSVPPRALFFDVFGTCVDWRESVINELHAQAHAALNSASASLASRVRMTASDMTIEHWGRFAQDWRDTYRKFTRNLAADPSLPWVSVDEHHLTSLKELMAAWKIEGLWNDVELRAISLIWHRLEPWEDSAEGVELLNQLFYTCTLSNGNHSLLADLRSYSKIPFTHLFSAEDFGTYKPAPRVYLGAAEKLNLPPEQCAMVAAHLFDLKAAKENGLQTIYVERPSEEEWNEDQIQSAKREGWVDLWVSAGDGNKGFVTVAEKLGIDVAGRNGLRRLSTSAPPGGA